jgi:hypothetical protein
MARPPEKVFWSEEEKLAVVMRAIDLRMHKMWDSPLHVLRASMTAFPADRRRMVRSWADAPFFVELHDKMLSERLIRHKGIGAEILSAVTEGWRLQHDAWVAQHTSLREAVHELKTQTAILSEILDCYRLARGKSVKFAFSTHAKMHCGEATVLSIAGGRPRHRAASATH